MSKNMYVRVKIYLFFEGIPHAYFIVAHESEDNLNSGKIGWKNERDMVKKIFGRIRWKRIVVEGVKLRVER